VYGGQMFASYILGQKHFPIPYNLRKFLLYSVLAISMYFIVSLLNIPFGAIQVLIHNGFVLIFVLLVWFMEKRELTS
jgi:uncharacterized membrane protein